MIQKYVPKLALTVERLQSRKQFLATIKGIWRKYDLHKSKKKFRTWFQIEKDWFQGEVDDKGHIKGLHLQILEGSSIVVAYCTDNENVQGQYVVVNGDTQTILTMKDGQQNGIRYQDNLTRPRKVEIFRDHKAVNQKDFTT